MSERQSKKQLGQAACRSAALIPGYWRVYSRSESSSFLAAFDLIDVAAPPPAKGSMPPPAHTPAPAAHRAPPPPPSLPGDFQDAAAAIDRRLVDVEQYQVPQLAQCTGPLSFHNELATAIRHELAKARRDLDELKVEADDLDRAKERVAASQLIASIQQRLDSCTKAYRQAVVASKRQIDASAHLVAREELFASTSGRGSPASGGSGPGRARSPMPGQSGDDALMQATSDVTEGLRRTLQLMQQEVDRSMTSNELLESQTQTMQLTSNQYSTLSSLMNTSKSLITTLERSNILDRLVLFGAFAFFVAVCAHIFKKRVIDRGVHVVGALGGIVAKGGNAIAGVARRGGAAEEVAQEARGVVKQGVAEEWAKATAVAAGAAGGIRAGIDMARTKATQALHERNVPTQTPSRHHEEEAAAEPADVLETVLPEEDNEPVVAAPVEVHEAVDDAGEPLHVFDEEMGLEEPIPGAAPTGEAFEPAVVEPLDNAFEEGEEEEDDALGFGLGEEGGEGGDLEPEDEEDDSLVDDDVQAPLDSAPAADTEQPDLPLAHDVETVALRQPHPPTPLLPNLPDLAFETPAAEEMPVQKPDLEEAVQAAEREEEEEDGEKIASPPSAVDSAPASPDEAEQAHFDDLDKESDEPTYGSDPEGDFSEPLDSAEQEQFISANEQPQASARSFHADLPIDYSDLDLDAAPLHTVPVQAEGDGDTQLPLGSTESINEDAELPHEVAGVEGITIPLDVLDEADAPPAVDVEGTGKVPADAPFPEEDRSVELPIDYAAEQTIWTDDAREGSADAERSVKEEEDVLSSSRESYEPHEQADEALLEELLERQMGGVAGGAYIPAYASFNETAAHEDDNKAEVSPPDAVPDDSAEIATSEESFHDSTPQSDSADEPSRVPHVTELTTEASIKSDVDRTEVHIDPTEGLEVLEAIEPSTVPGTIEPIAVPILTSPPAVPEPTPMHGHSHGESFDSAFDEADVALDEEELDGPEAEAADPEPLPGLPTQTAPDTFNLEATESAAAVAGSDAQRRVDKTDVEDSSLISDAQPGVPTSAPASPTVAPVDVEQTSREDLASSSTTQPPPIPDHSIIANPKAAVEASAGAVDVLESVLHEAPEPTTLEVEPPATTSAQEAVAASSSASQDALPEQEDDESFSAFEASSVDGEHSEVSPTEDEESEVSAADFEGSPVSAADFSRTNDEDDGDAEEEEDFEEEFDEDEEGVADDAPAAPPVHVEL